MIIVTGVLLGKIINIVIILSGMEQFPDGQLNETDEGALAIAVKVENGRLILDFGKDLSWIGLDKASLRRWIDLLEEKYKQL